MNPQRTPVSKRWTPGNWASLKPFGIGEQRPNNYVEVLRAVFENRDELAYAWRILRDGVCDGCALGTSGMRDWTLEGVHLCNVRLRLLRLNTLGPLNPRVLEDVSALAALSGEKLRELGRLPYPMLRRRGERGFRRVSWDDALELAASHIRAASPDRLGFYLTSRGIPNEAYYAAQKAVRAMGTNSIDNAARVCHSPSTTALKDMLGVGATTCSYQDWLQSDLIVFIGSNVANNQPVATKYLHYAKKNGARIVVINSYREPGMERYWVPSVPESALFGTRIADDFFLIDTGGDVAFLTGTFKCLMEMNGVDRDFIQTHTEGFAETCQAAQALDWEALEQESGIARGAMREFAALLASAERGILVWSMGITQHTRGVENVRAIVNLALARGYLGREGCGLMPIRGHSGVQGGAEMGAYATAFPGGLPVTAEHATRLAELWGFPPPSTPGLAAPDMVDAAADGALDVLFSVGGNFLEVLPDPKHVRAALERVPLRVHMDIVLSGQMLLEPGEAVLLLPAATRYETPGGVTQTSTERRVIFSPEIPGRRIGEARPEWEVFLDLARRVRPELAEKLQYEDTAAIRAEIARVVPYYDGIQHLARKGDQFQYGGRHLCAGGACPTPTGKARFRLVTLAPQILPEGAFLLSTRRGKQFNSMVHEPTDQLTGAKRFAILMNPEDAQQLDLCDADPVLLRNEHGAFHGHIQTAPVKAGNLQVHWPEGNTLLDRRRRAEGAGVPDYNAVVHLEKLPQKQKA
ncbi:MAG: FdhF/YdeP family oxidoreductase [Candidatus Hydrogenedentes bacterium]|nr:FdhF/YdeP family oxidoreductase [Candidatus Hydrogenedentota bacterium]